jgi:hypothetical protein
MPYNGYVTLLPDTVDFCTAYIDLCNDMLDHVQCPTDNRNVLSCSTAGDYATFAPTCTCWNYDITDRIAEDIYDAIMSPNTQPLILQPNTTVAYWETCSSYASLCNKFLEFIGCENSLRSVTTCGNVTTENPFGQIQFFQGTCQCGSITQLSARPQQAIITAMVSQNINNNYLYLAPAQAAYTLSVSSNPFKQLLYPSYPVISTQ